MTVEPLENYITFEVLRDIFRNCIVLDTRLSPMAMIFAAVVYPEQAVEVMIALFLVYGITLAVHWVLFVISYIVLGIYFRKAHLVLRRSFAMMRGAAYGLSLPRNPNSRGVCRRLDPKRFLFLIWSDRRSPTSFRRNGAAAATNTLLSPVRRSD